MSKRSFGLAAAVALVLPFSMVAIAPAATTVPAVVQIEDPVGDANYLNDQDILNGVPEDDGRTTPVDAGSVSDLMKIWYSNDATTISVHIQTELPIPATQAYIFRVYSNIGEGPVGASSLGCLRFFAFVPGSAGGGGYGGDQYAGLLDACDVGLDYAADAQQGELLIETLDDGTGLMTITVPRAYSPKLADGQVLTTPWANVRNIVGTGPEGDGQPLGEDPNGRWRGLTQIDETMTGTDYTIVSSKPSPAPCKKGKGKKKCPKPPKSMPTPTPSTAPSP